MSGADPLSGEIRALFTQLAHGGDLVACDGASEHAGEDAGCERILCGEAGRIEQAARVRFQLRLSGHTVLEARYRAYGCPYTLGTCEWLARALTGCRLSALSPAALTQAVGGALDWAERLGIPAERLGRLLVIEDALRAALSPGKVGAQSDSPG